MYNAETVARIRALAAKGTIAPLSEDELREIVLLVRQQRMAAAELASKGKRPKTAKQETAATARKSRKLTKREEAAILDQPVQIAPIADNTEETAHAESE